MAVLAGARVTRKRVIGRVGAAAAEVVGVGWRTYDFARGLKLWVPKTRPDR
jgi:hypothetical protein